MTLRPALLLAVPLLALATLAERAAGQNTIKLTEGVPYKFTLDPGFPLTCPHKRFVLDYDTAVLEVSGIDAFTKNPVYTLHGLQVGTTTARFQLIAKDTYQKNPKGNCQGSFTSVSYDIMVLPDFRQADKQTKKDGNAIRKSLKQELGGYRQAQRSLNASAISGWKKGEITLEAAYSQISTAFGDTMFMGFEAGWGAGDSLTMNINSQLSGLGASDGFLSDANVSGRGGVLDDNLRRYTMDWWGASMRATWDAGSAMDKLNRMAGDDPNAWRFAFSGNWNTFHDDLPKPGVALGATTGHRAEPEILCAIARALACTSDMGGFTIGGYASPLTNMTIRWTDPLGASGSATFDSDADGRWSYTLGLNLTFEEGVLPINSGTYRVEVSYTADPFVGDQMYLTVP